MIPVLGLPISDLGCSHAPTAAVLVRPKAATSAPDPDAGVVVAADVDASGRVTAVHVYRHSDDPTLEAAAVQALHDSTFTPAQAGCHASAGTFVVEDNFFDQGSCDRDARVAQAVIPQRPSDVRLDVIPAASVRVSVDPAGNVIDASIEQSTGSAELDGAALSAAKQSVYEPSLKHCKPVLSTALFQAAFYDASH